MARPSGGWPAGWLADTGTIDEDPAGTAPNRGGRTAASHMADKKLVLLCQHFYPEMVSTGMHMTELATRLAELGWQITVLTSKPSWGTDDPDAGPVPAEMVYQNVRILRVPTLGSQSGSLVSKTVSARLVRALRRVGAVAETSRLPQPRDHDEPPLRWGAGMGRRRGSFGARIWSSSTTSSRSSRSAWGSCPRTHGSPSCGGERRA